mgnify:CR=1 FL=1
MKILTHTSIGLFAGVILYYFLDLDIGFILLAGFAAFIPDIDWRMQFSWKMGNVHRKALHNIWVLAVLIILVYFVFKNLLMVSAVALGFLTHLIADSFTVTGVYWLYPLGRQNEKFHMKGPLSMSTKKADKIEAFLQTIFFTCSGFIFFQKNMAIEIFSMQGAITVIVLLIAGYSLFKTLGKVVERTIREAKL